MGDEANPVDRGVLFEALPTPCFVLSPELIIWEVNDAYLNALRVERYNLLGRCIFDVFPDTPDDPGNSRTRDNVRASLERVRSSGEEEHMPVQKYAVAVHGTDGSRLEERHWGPVNTPLFGPDGQLLMLMHRVDDVTEAHRAQAQLRTSERRFRAVVEHASDIILIVGAEHELIYVSPALRRLLPQEPEALGSVRWGDMAHPDDRPAALDLFARAQDAPAGETLSGRFRLGNEAERVRWVEARATNHLADPAVNGVILNVRDVTEQHEAEQTLKQQALQDSLTGLPNRRWFIEAVKRATARAAGTSRTVALVLIDVDHFKLVNDSMGHPAGDRLLVELADRMVAALRPSDRVARLGGDEFAVLAEDLGHERDACGLARRMAAAASGHYRPDSALQIRATVFVGVSTSAGATDPDSLLAQADAALYEAKRAGRDRIEVFDPGLRRHVVHRVRLEHELHDALDADDLVLHWQPIVAVQDGTLMGAEALVRWQHPQRGLLRPAEFLPAVDGTALMRRLGARVLDRAFAQAAAWQRLPAPPRVFINLAAQEIVAPTLANEVAALAAAHKVDTRGVSFEISEQLATLKELGCDFAQGYHIALPQRADTVTERLAQPV